MAWYGKHARLTAAGDSGDPVWRWFILNGPHGEGFRWYKGGRSRKDHRGGRGSTDLELLSQCISERAQSDSDFPEKARAVALQALGLEDPVLVRTGIQVLAALGHADDLVKIQALLDHPDPEVAKDARCCLFERGIKRR